ncbi:MAG: hypothetical protein AAB215_04925 [Planctomycetota bacterium]
MKGLGLSLSEYLRYFLIGSYAFVLLLVSGHGDIGRSLKDAGLEPEVFIPLASILSGITFHHVYKILLYVPLLTRLQDLMSRRNPTYRTLLRTRYNGLSQLRAIAFWRYIRNKNENDNLPIEKESSAVHFLYMASALTVIVPLILGVEQMLIGLLVGIGLFVASLLYDRHLEQFETFVYRSITNEKMDGYARECGVL